MFARPSILLMFRKLARHGTLFYTFSDITAQWLDRSFIWQGTVACVAM